MSTYTVTAATYIALMERVGTLMRFGWAMLNAPHKSDGVWEVTLYMH